MKNIPIIFWMVVLSGFQACGQQTLEQKLESIYKLTVPLVQPEKLYQWKQSNNDLVILDTRSDGEYKVSHIEGAQFIDYQTFGPEQVASVPKSSTVVVYCSVGYRSERIGEKLRSLGFSEVYNLYGGIFQWKNKGFEVVDVNEQVTDSVHTYNENWSKWLQKGVKVYD